MERPRGPISAARQRGGSDNDRPDRRARAFAGLAAAALGLVLATPSWAQPPTRRQVDPNRQF